MTIVVSNGFLQTKVDPEELTRTGLGSSCSQKHIFDCVVPKSKDKSKAGIWHRMVSGRISMFSKRAD